MSKNKHQIWCLLLAGLVGFIFYTYKQAKIFPTASINMALSQADIASQARILSKKLGYSQPGAISSTIFTYDDDAKTFLEYELGTSRANELMREKIPIWYWLTRYCVPLQQEEFKVWMNPQGKLSSFEHTIPNDRPLPSLSQDAAQSLAEKFVRDQGGIDLSKAKLVEEGEVKQAARVDYSYFWEDTDEDFRGAKLRSHVIVSGNQVSTYSRYLYVPEAFTRKFENLRSYNLALANSADLFYQGLSAAAFFIFLWALATGTIRWRFSLTVASVFAVCSCLEALNSMPNTISGYETSLPYDVFQLQLALETLYEAGKTFFETLVLVGSAEAVYRLMKPHDICLETTFTKTGLRSSKTLENLLVGLALFGLHLGWISVYYLAGRKFGFWSPAEVDNAESLSSIFPFFSAMQVGLSAGLTEELIYRVIGLAAFKKLVRNFWLANLLQAVAWGFMHSNYAQEPPYVRGVELTVIGFIYGAALRRFGLLACFFSHNLIDTYIGISPLLSSTIASLHGSAWLAILPFAVVIVVSLVLIKRYGAATGQEEKPILNESLATARDPPLSEIAGPLRQGYLYKPLTKLMRVGLVLAAVASMGVIWFSPYPVIGARTQLKLGRDEAIKQARAYMLKQGLNPEGYSVTAWLGYALNNDAMQYVFEIVKRKMTDQLSMSPERPVWWTVRFFKPQEEEEFHVGLDQDGKIMQLNITEPETAAGEKIDKEEARRRAEQFLTRIHPEVMPFEFDDITQVKRDARLDYTVRYSVPKYKIGDAKYQVAVDVIGGRISGYISAWDVPDQWLFKRKIPTLREQICQCILYVAIFVCGIAVLVWAIGVLKSGAIRWRPAAIIGLAVAAFSVLLNVNDAPMFFYSYETNVPLSSYYVGQAVGYIVTAMSAFAMATLLAAFGLAALKLLLVDTSLAAIVKTTFWPSGSAQTRSHKNLWTDAALVGYAAAFGDLALTMLASLAHALFSTEHTTAAIDVLCRFANMLNPAAGTLADACQRGISMIFIAALLVGIYAKYLRNFRNYMLFSLVLGLLTVSTYKVWQDAAIDFVSLVISIVCTWLFIARFAKENLLAYFITGSTSVLIFAIRVLSRLGEPIYTQDLGAMTVFLLAPAVYALTRLVASGKERSDVIVESANQGQS